MENQEFKNKFIERYKYLLKNQLSSERMLQQINLFETLYQSEIKRHIARWRYPCTFQWWQQEVEKMKEFARERQEIVLEQIREL